MTKENRERMCEVGARMMKETMVDTKYNDTKKVCGWSLTYDTKEKKVIIFPIYEEDVFIEEEQPKFTFLEKIKRWLREL